MVAPKSGLALLVVSLLVAACGGSDTPGTVNGSVEGSVYVTGPVAGIQVAAYALDADTGDRGKVLGTSEPTDDVGHFHVDVGIHHGPLLLVARGVGGRYVEPASGVTVSFDSTTELRAVFVQEPSPAEGLSIDFPRGKAITNQVLSPWTELAVQYGSARLTAQKSPTFERALVDAHNRFRDLLKVDFWSVLPADLTKPTGGWNDGVQAGVELAGLSRLVRNMAEKSQIDPSGLTSLQLLSALRRDLSDANAVFDGLESNQAPLAVGTCDTICKLSARTLSGNFAEAIAKFLGDASANGSGIDVAAAEPLITYLACPWRASAGAGELFPAGLDCAFDSEAPDVTVERLDGNNADPLPAQGAAILTGTVQLRVTGTDSVDIKSLQVSFLRDGLPISGMCAVGAPTAFCSVVEQSPNKLTLIQTYTLDTTALVDGPVKMQVIATDEAGNATPPSEYSLLFDNTSAGHVGGTATVGGRVAHGRVRIFELDGATRGLQLGQAFTDDDGVYFVEIPDTTSHTLQIVVDADPAGTTTYVEASNGTAVTFSAGDSIESIVTGWENGAERVDGNVTPWTHIAAQLARAVWLVTFNSVPAKWPDAVEAAYAMLEQHFMDGGPTIALRDVTPSDLTTAVNNGTLTAAVRYGLMITALGQLADKHAIQSGATTASMNTFSLTKKLAEDASVCAANGSIYECLDGRSSGALVHGVVALDSYVTRTDLAIAAVDFLETNPRNATSFHELDVAQLLDIISADAGDRGADRPRLYPAAATPLPYDVIDPVVAYIAPTPAPNAVLRGQVIIKATATDNRALASMAFSGPLVANISGITLDTTNGTGMVDRDGPWVLVGTLNADALGDGPQTVVITAKDEANRSAPASQSELRLIVDKTAPQLAITGAVAGGSSIGDNGFTGANSVMVSGSVSDANLQAVSFRVGSGASTTITPSGGTFTFTAALAGGANVVTVTAADRAGNSKSVAATYNRDSTAPTVGLVSMSISTIETAALPPAGSQIGLATYSLSGGLVAITDGAVFNKYASNYGPTSSNLPVWQFNLSDNHTAATAIVLKGRLSSNNDGTLTDWFVISGPGGGGFTRSQVVSSALDPSIATENDTFTLEYQAFDEYNNASAIGSVHWRQTLKAPPVRQFASVSACATTTVPQPPNPASCPDRYLLGGDHQGSANNAQVLIQGGTALPDGKAYFATGKIDNPNLVPVRLQFSVTSSGSYGYWYKSAAPESSSSVSAAPDLCSTENFIHDHNLDGSCVADGPGLPEDRKLVLNVSNLFSDLQVVTDAGVVLPVCTLCTANEREIPAQTRVTVFLRSNPWSFLWPLATTLAAVSGVDASGAATATQDSPIKHCAATGHPPGGEEVCTRWALVRRTKFLQGAKLTPQASVTLKVKPATFVGSYAPGEDPSTSNFSYSPLSWCRQRNPVNDPLFSCP